MKYHIAYIFPNVFILGYTRKGLREHFFSKCMESLKAISFFTLFFLPTLFFGPIHAANFNTVYFYNSEANINNFVSLKIEFDTYLSQLGAYRFQPFNQQKNFEDSIALKNNSIFMLSSWHYQSLREKYPLKSVLIGETNGKSTHKRILSAKKQIKSIAQLKGKKVASAGSREYTQTILKQILGEKGKNIINSIKIQLVPKDIDALLAVGFGMADAALTTENSINIFKGINHKQYLLLRKIGQSTKQYLPVVAVMGKEVGKNKALLGFLARMNSTSEGKSKLRMLGLDRLRVLNRKESKDLSNEK